MLYGCLPYPNRKSHKWRKLRHGLSQRSEEEVPLKRAGIKEYLLPAYAQFGQHLTWVLFHLGR